MRLSLSVGICLVLCAMGIVGCRDAPGPAGESATANDSGQTADGPKSPRADARQLLQGNRALPEDSFLAQWTQRTEGIFDAVLELQSIVGIMGQEVPIGDDDRAWALWQQISEVLPAEDLLRQRLATAVARYFYDRDSLRAAQAAEHSNMPGWGSVLYESLGRSGDSARVRAKAQEYGRQEEALSEWAREIRQAGQDISTSLASRTQAERLKYLTTGVDNAFVRNCERGFSAFVSVLPDNPRFRRAMTVYYVPARGCGLSSPDGEFDVSEAMLRLTAEAFPERLGKTYQLITAAGYGQFEWFIGLSHIPGDFSPSGNALVLARDLLRKVPSANGEMLATARSRMQQAADARGRCRWAALVAYLEDGAPDPGEDPKTMLLAKLAGDSGQRRWALAWLPNQLAEAAPVPYPYVTDAELAQAVVAAAEKCETAEDRLLALDALRILPPISGLELICQAAGVEEDRLSGMAIRALMVQYRRAQPRMYGPEDRRAIQPNADFLAVLPALRKAFYPHLNKRAWSTGEDVINIFAELQDPELDAQMAGYLAAQEITETSTISHVAWPAQKYPQVGWDKTIAVLEDIAKALEPKLALYAANMARSLREGVR